MQELILRKTEQFVRQNLTVFPAVAIIIPKLLRCFQY